MSDPLATEGHLFSIPRARPKYGVGILRLDAAKAAVRFERPVLAAATLTKKDPLDDLTADELRQLIKVTEWHMAQQPVAAKPDQPQKMEEMEAPEAIDDPPTPTLSPAPSPPPPVPVLPSATTMPSAATMPLVTGDHVRRFAPGTRPRTSFYASAPGCRLSRDIEKARMALAGGY
jgi:hypothetical protein